MRKLFEYGGIAASVVLIASGIGAVVVGGNGRSTVRDNLSLEKIEGTPDMTPSAIKAEAAKAGLKNVSLPTCSVANKPVNTGSRARCFATYIRIHALEATGGQTYAEMPRFLGKDGKPTGDEKLAATKAGKPVDNPARDTWVTATSLSTALNTSYFAERVAVFSIVMGIALLLTGIGFLVLTLTLLHKPAKQEEPKRQPAPSS